MGALGNVSDVCISSCNTAQSTSIPGHALILTTGPSDVGSVDFIKEGFASEWSRERNIATEMLVGELTIKPKRSTLDDTGKEREFNIDHESYDVRPMKLRP